MSSNPLDGRGNGGFPPERVEKGRDAHDNLPTRLDSRFGPIEVAPPLMLGLVLLALCVGPNQRSSPPPRHVGIRLLHSSDLDRVAGHPGPGRSDRERDLPGSPLVDEVEPEGDVELFGSILLIPAPLDLARSDSRHHHPILIVLPSSAPNLSLRLRC